MARPASRRSGPSPLSRPEIWPTGYPARSARGERTRAGSNEQSAYWPPRWPRLASTPRTRAPGSARGTAFELDEQRDLLVHALKHLRQRGHLLIPAEEPGARQVARG